MPFIFTFAFIYLLSTIVGQNMRIFTLNPKWIHIQSPAIYTLLIFPYRFIGYKTNVHQKEQKLMLSELLFCICNQIILAGAMILQIIPAIPCEVIEITFGQRYRGFDVTVDTYNQKIPLAAILALVSAEMLFLFGEIVVRALRNTEFRKKLGTGAFVGIIALCLLFLAVLILSVCLLF